MFTCMLVVRLLCAGDAPLVLGLEPATGAMERYIGLDVSMCLLCGCCRRVPLDACGDAALQHAVRGPWGAEAPWRVSRCLDSDWQQVWCPGS